MLKTVKLLWHICDIGFVSPIKTRQTSGLLIRWLKVRFLPGVLVTALVHKGLRWYRKPFVTIHNIAKWTKWDPLGHFFGSKRAVVLVETVPLCCHIQDRSWQKLGFLLLCDSYGFLIGFLGQSVADIQYGYKYVFRIQHWKLLQLTKVIAYSIVHYNISNL